MNGHRPPPPPYGYGAAPGFAPPGQHSGYPPPGYAPPAQPPQYAPPQAAPPALYTVNYRCKDCGRVLATCQGASHAQLQQAIANGARTAFCPEPGHNVNINLAHEIVPYVPQPPAPPPPPPVQAATQQAYPPTSQPAQSGTGGAVLGSVMGTPAPKMTASDEPAVDPAAEEVLKRAVEAQTAEIAQRGGNLGIASARTHAPIAGEAPIHPNGTTQP